MDNESNTLDMEIEAVFFLGLYFAFISTMWIGISIFGSKRSKVAWRREVSGIYGLIFFLWSMM